MADINFDGWDNEKVGAYFRTSQQRDRKKGDETRTQSFEIEELFIPSIPKGAVAKTARLGYASTGKSRKVGKDEDRPKPIGGKVVVYNEGAASGFARAGPAGEESEDTGQYKRPVLKQMLQDAKDGLITKVIIITADRLANDPMLWGRIGDELREYGTDVVDMSTGYSVSGLKAGEDFDLSKLGDNMMLMIYSGTAEIQKKSQIAKSFVGTRIARAERGRCQGNMGYILTKDYIDLHTDIEGLDAFNALTKDMTQYGKTKVRRERIDNDDVMSDVDIAKKHGFGKKQPDTGAIRNWRKKFKEWKKAGVLIQWLATIRDLQDLRAMVKVGMVGDKKIAAALTNNSCYLLYPAKGDSPFKGEVYEPESREKILSYANA